MVSHAISHGFPVLRPSRMPRKDGPCCACGSSTPPCCSGGPGGVPPGPDAFWTLRGQQKKARICQQKRVGNDETSRIFFEPTQTHGNDMDLLGWKWGAHGIIVGYNPSLSLIYGNFEDFCLEPTHGQLLLWNVFQWIEPSTASQDVDCVNNPLMDMALSKTKESKKSIIIHEIIWTLISQNYDFNGVNDKNGDLTQTHGLCTETMIIKRFWGTPFWGKPCRREPCFCWLCLFFKPGIKKCAWSISWNLQFELYNCSLHGPRASKPPLFIVKQASQNPSPRNIARTN